MISILALLLAVPATVLTFDCSDKTDGIYGTGCRSYTRCVGGVATVHDCPNDGHSVQVFNNKTQACDIPDHVDPPCGRMKDCSQTSDGTYADLDQHCKTYYTCNGGTFFGHTACAPGLVFDAHLRTCNWPKDTAPPCGTHH